MFFHQKRRRHLKTTAGILQEFWSLGALFPSLFDQGRDPAAGAERCDRRGPRTPVMGQKLQIILHPSLTVLEDSVQFFYLGHFGPTGMVMFGK